MEIIYQNRRGIPPLAFCCHLVLVVGCSDLFPHLGAQRSIHSQSHGPVYGADLVNPSVSSMQLVIGNRAWDVDPSKDPQLQQPRPGANGSVGQGPAPSRMSPPVTAGEDPLVKQMAELSTAAAASGSTGRRNTIVWWDVPPLSSPPGTSSCASPPGAGVVWSNDKGETLSMPASGPSSTRDFCNSTEIVVGGYPLAPSHSASPNPVPPRAALAAPPSRADSSSSPSSVSYPAASNIPIEQIVMNYQWPFPGEPGRSRANSIVGQPPLNLPPLSLTSALIAGSGQGLTHSPIQQQEPGTRPTSHAGYPGIGTTSLIGRAPSPVHPTSAGAGAMQPYNRAGPVVSAAAAAGNGGQQHSVVPQILSELPSALMAVSCTTRWLFSSVIHSTAPRPLAGRCKHKGTLPVLGLH